MYRRLTTSGMLPIIGHGASVLHRVSALDFEALVTAAAEVDAIRSGTQSLIRCDGRRFTKTVATSRAIVRDRAFGGGSSRFISSRNTSSLAVPPHRWAT